MALLLRSLYFYFASCAPVNLDMAVLDLYAVLQLY